MKKSSKKNLFFIVLVVVIILIVIFFIIKKKDKFEYDDVLVDENDEDMINPSSYPPFSQKIYDISSFVISALEGKENTSPGSGYIPTVTMKPIDPKHYPIIESLRYYLVRAETGNYLFTKQVKNTGNSIECFGYDVNFSYADNEDVGNDVSELMDLEMLLDIYIYPEGTNRPQFPTYSGYNFNSTFIVHENTGTLADRITGYPLPLVYGINPSRPIERPYPPTQRPYNE